MTIIIRCEIQGVHVMIGDALLTRDCIEDGVLAIPSVRSSTAVYGEFKNNLAGLVQKVSLFNDRAIFCFAGAYTPARDAALTLAKHLRLGTPVEEAWKLTISSLTFSERQELSLLFDGFELPDDGESYRYAASLHVKRCGDIGVFKELEVAGSGKKEVLEILRRHPISPYGQGSGTYEFAVQQALSVSAKFLDLDLRSRKSFESNFGGFYEIALWYGNRYIKLDGVQYVFWTKETTADHVRFRLDRIYMQYYEGSTLCVDEALVSELVPDRISTVNGATLPLSKVLHHRVPTIESGFEGSEFRVQGKTNFVHRLTVHCMRHDPPDIFGCITTIRGMIRSPEKNPDIKVEENFIHIRPGYLQQYRDELVSAFQRDSELLHQKMEAERQRTWKFKLRRLFRSAKMEAANSDLVRSTVSRK